MDESKVFSLETLSLGKDEEETPSVSIPLEDGEVVEQMDLNEYARKLAQELFRVRSIIEHVSIDEIGARIEECKVAMSMYKNLFEILVGEHTKRINTNISGISDLTP